MHGQINVKYYNYVKIVQYFCVYLYFFGGKQWQPTPKNLPRMQCARAIPVA